MPIGIGIKLERELAGVDPNRVSGEAVARAQHDLHRLVASSRGWRGSLSLPRSTRCGFISAMNRSSLDHVLAPELSERVLP